MRETLDLLGAVNLPERVTTLVYLTDSSEFPINRLRNLGIRNIQTSHFMVLDMDLMLSRNLNEELEKLPAAQREAVLLHYFHQFTVKEIAQMTNTPLPTVKSRLRAARSTLSDDLWEDFS